MSDIHDELSPDESERLHKLSQALREEFAIAESGQTKRSPIKDLEDLKEDFLKGIKDIVKHSDNEPLKAKVAMWGYDKLLESGKAGTDPLRDLLEGLDAAKETVRVNDEDGS